MTSGESGSAGGNISSPLPEAYLPGLDVLRILACGAVMQFHTPSLANLGGLVKAYGGAGYLGVDLFMLISGWLIGGQLIREHLRAGTIKLRRLYFKRWMRTLPPYFAMLIVLSPGLLHDGLSLRSYLLHYVFLQQYFGVNAYGVSWSLCVEEHFYLLCPFVVALAMKSRRLWRVVGGVVLVCVLSLLTRVFSNPGMDLVGQVTHQRMDGLWIGLLFAYVAQVHPDVWARLGRFANVVGLTGLVLAAIVFYDMQSWPHQFVYQVSVATLILALIFFAFVQQASVFANVRFPGLRFLGELTFPLYLIHTVLPQQWARLPLPGGMAVGIVWRLFLVCAASALLLYAVIEPSMKLRARLLSRSTPARNLPPRMEGPSVEEAA